MAISYRPMRSKDVRECVTILAAHSVVASRYSDALNDLRSVWLGLLGRDAFRAVVFEQSRGGPAKIIGVGVSAFVSDEFLCSLKTPPFAWVGPELTRRISRGESPLLSERAMREANSKGGLNLVVWEGALREELWECVEANSAVFSAFIEQHQGFLLKEVIGHSMTRLGLDGVLRSGGQLLREDGSYVDSLDRSLDEVFKMPHYVGLTREVAQSRVGAWIGSLFVYRAPRFGFRPSEQRLLLAALRGRTDQELADHLGLSLSAVKKAWLSIYDRVAMHLPSLFSNNLSTQEGAERGKEKKQHLIAYLRDHPEELRPASA